MFKKGPKGLEDLEKLDKEIGSRLKKRREGDDGDNKHLGWSTKIKLLDNGNYSKILKNNHKSTLAEDFKERMQTSIAGIN